MAKPRPLKKIPLKDYLATGTPQAELVASWVKTEGNFPRTRQISTALSGYFTDEVVEALEGTSLTPRQKLLGLRSWRPLVSGLTMEEFVRFIKKQNGFHMWNWRDVDWRLAPIASRSPVGPDKWELERVLRETYKPSGVNTGYARELNLLNDYFASSYEGTFAAYLEEPLPPEVEERLARDVFVDYGGTLKTFLRAAISETAANFGPPAKKETKDFLFALPKETLRAVYARYGEDSRRRGHANTLLFVESITSPPAVLRSPEAVRKLLLEKLTQAAVREAGDFSPHQYVTVMQEGMALLPGTIVVKNQLQEYDAIASALEPLELGLLDVVGFLYCLQHPVPWLRGQNTNSFLLLGKLLKSSEPEGVVKLLSELVLRNEDHPPSFTEWEASLEKSAYSMPLAFFLPLYVNTKAKKSHVASQLVDFRQRVLATAPQG